MILLAIAGLIAGVLSGLLGIGGGLVLVPCLLMAQAELGADPAKVALATSLATIPFTGGWAAFQQTRLGNVDFSKVKMLSFGVAIGAVAGSCTATLVPDVALRVTFVAFAVYVGFQMLMDAQPRIPVEFSAKSAAVAGLVTGALSSWVGIGGGTVVVPFLTSTGEPVKKAVGISSAVGVVVAAFASVGYAFGAWHLGDGGAAPGRLGYVHIAAFASIVPASLIGAYVGVRLGARVSAPRLKKIFAVVLLASAAKLLTSI